MGIFNFHKSHNANLPDAQKRWNKMWDLWSAGHADSPYAELMTYQSEINNGGHGQYFLNTRNTCDLQQELSVLEAILPLKLQKNLENAYHAYLTLMIDDSDEKANVTLNQCDDEFYQSEEEIDHILREYASEIEL